MNKFSTFSSSSASRLSGLSRNAVRYTVDVSRALDLGRVDEADRHLIGLVALYPDHPEVLRLVAGILSLRGETGGAIETMRRAMALRPDDALYYDTLGTILLADNDYDAAIAAFSRACELHPKFAGAWHHLGLALMHCVRPAEAASAFRRAVALEPNHVAAQTMLAYMLSAQGKFLEAIAEFRRALAKRPWEGIAWWGLAEIKTVRFDDSDVAAIRRAMLSPQASENDLVAMGFALAKALDERNCFAESLAELARANVIARRRYHWNAADHAVHVDLLLDAFSSSPESSESSELGQEAIFIVSMPRSGSTLTEQVLASHSQVEGAAELLDLSLVLTEESKRRGKPFSNWATEAHREDWQRLGRRYLERTARWREKRPRFTDKLPGNWLYIGAIRAMLPGAKIVVVRRDPLETCFSCYRQHFAKNEHTRTFADLASAWRDFDRTVRHWKDLYPEHIYENSYEEFVSEPERAIRDLLAFCDLDFEPACLEFHKNLRDVHTPSAAQVREPIRRDAARSAKYGALLDPLRGELGMLPYAPSNPG